MRARLRDDSGGVSAELAVITPLLMLILLLIVQFALAMHAQHVAQAAASRALAQARADGGTAAAGQARAESVLAAIGGRTLQNPSVQVTRDGTTVRVVIRGSTVSVVPGMHPGVKAVVSGPVDTFRPDISEAATSDTRR
ncbi:pilus assembly protein (plasmid) [Embleya sp. NBC_00888]|uniref:TadE/TadG family type IV pilus assembly protein n=1 Tax=Embleya sp. NBC_00888 TaxID=2975960 RepID=UPI002F910A88|nr:pilus assembly protein [Embleya sp. NBC_00888]